MCSAQQAYGAIASRFDHEGILKRYCKSILYKDKYLSERMLIPVATGCAYKFVHCIFALACFVLPSQINTEAARSFSTTAVCKE